MLLPSTVATARTVPREHAAGGVRSNASGGLLAGSRKIEVLRRRALLSIPRELPDAHRRTVCPELDLIGTSILRGLVSANTSELLREVHGDRRNDRQRPDQISVHLVRIATLHRPRQA